MKKVLFTATVDSHILQFHLPFLKLFKENGYEVHVATNGNEEIPYCDVKHVVPFERSPLKLNNLKAIKQLKKIINEEKLDIIHTHTPMGSVVTRLAAKKARKKYHTRVIYTAHGLHFFKGAPLKNWLMFYPIEKYLSKYTDTLILINQEDYDLCKRKFKKCKDIQYVPGVGIDEEKFNFEMSDKEKHELRKSLGIKDDDFVMIYPAELNWNKNQLMIINAIEELSKKYENIKVLLPGVDSYKGYYQNLVKEKQLENYIKFLGYRKDIPQLLKISDLAVATSHREGLPLNIMEAMYAGLPIIATDCRGQRDLVKDHVNGYLVSINDQERFNSCIEKIYLANGDNNKYGEESKYVIKEYLLDKIISKLSDIYFKKIRIVHLLSSNSYSGAENVACTIINYMSNEFDMYYCCPRGPIEEKLKEKEIKYIPIKSVTKKEVKNIQKKYNIDIIHAHDVRASFIASSCSKNARIISHIHGNHLYMRKMTLQSLLYLISSIRFEHIFWVSDSAYENFKYKNMIKQKSSILFNIIDYDDVIEKVNKDNKLYYFDIIYLGRLNEAKNPMRMVKLFHELTLINSKIKCAIVGDGELFSKVKNYIKENKLDQNVKMFGFQSNPYKILASSKIMLITSIHEGVPMVALEAMALGIPIISTPTDGLINLIDEENGYLSDEDSDIINKIIEILEYNKLKLKELNKSVVNKFNVINDVEKYTNELKSEYMNRK